MVTVTFEIKSKIYFEKGKKKKFYRPGDSFFFVMQVIGNKQFFKVGLTKYDKYPFFFNSNNMLLISSYVTKFWSSSVSLALAEIYFLNCLGAVWSCLLAVICICPELLLLSLFSPLTEISKYWFATKNTSLDWDLVILSNTNSEMVQKA